MTWDLDPVFLRIGTFALRYYSVLFLASLIVGYLLLAQAFEKLGAPVEEAGDFLAYGIVAAMLGGRLGHVLFYDLDKAIEDPVWIVQIWTGGMASHGVIIAMFVAAVWFCQRRGITVLQLTDLLARPLLLGGVLIRLGAFFNSEGVGRITSSALGMRFPAYDFGYVEAPTRHPAQLYEAALCLALFFVITYIEQFLRQRAVGLVTAVSLGLYSAMRFGVEFVREFQTLINSTLTMGQYLSLGSFGIAAVLLTWALLRKERTGWLEDETSTATQ